MQVLEIVDVLFGLCEDSLRSKDPESRGDWSCWREFTAVFLSANRIDCFVRVLKVYIERENLFL